MSSAIPAWSVSRFHPLCDNILVRRRLPDATTGAGVLIPDAVRKPLDIAALWLWGRAVGRTMAASFRPPSLRATKLRWSRIVARRSPWLASSFSW